MGKYPLLDLAFDPQKFRQEGHEMVDRLADYLESMIRGSQKVTDHQSPQELLAQFDQYDFKSIGEFYEKILAYTIAIQNPNYMGHQVAAPAPLASITSLMDTMINNGMGIYEMGELPTVIEKRVIDIFCENLGYKNGDGLLTSGGTLANLTALLAARANYNDNVWTKGSEEKYCILVSEMAHYCVDRAVRIMGWGSDGIVKVPVNSSYAMDTTQLHVCYDQATQSGKRVVAIVGSAPCTATGSYDDLESIASFCKAKNIWLHIDGAHGGAAIFSKKYKHLMHGAHLADSVVIDAHKMMLTPALATALLFKNSNDSYKTFSQKADYLWENQNDKEWYNIARRSFECTKVAMSLRIMTLINQYGVEIFDQFLTRQYDLALEFYQIINGMDDFEAVMKPHSNIVCFRYVPQKGLSENVLSKINREIRKKILDKGTFYIVQTELNNSLYLRVTLMSPNTEISHINNLFKSIRQEAYSNVNF